MLSLRCVMPDMPMMAALSAAHLAAILFPDTLRRLYIARDDDPAGDRYKIPHNSPCFVNGTWWASAAAAAGLCVTVENPNDVSSP